MAGSDLKPLFDTILEYIPAPEADEDAPFQMLVSSIDYNEFVGRIAVGRIERGTVKQNQEIAVCNFHEPDAAPKKAKASALYEFDGLAKVPVTESTAGNIIAMSGIGDVTIGDTICAPDAVEPIEFVKISAPTIEMTFSVNDSPFAGREGKFVTSRQLRERLIRETMKDVSLRVTETDSTDAFNVAGRGEMSLSILIETMRREGYELQVSPPRVLYQEIDGVKCEPIERLVVDVPSDCVGAVMEKIGSRKGDLVEMTPVGDRMKIEFLVPARGLFGYRNEFLTDTKGEGIMASVFDSYAPMKGEIQRRNTGSLVAFETGEAVTYGLFNAQERGVLFIGAGTPVYAGMVVGETIPGLGRSGKRSPPAAPRVMGVGEKVVALVPLTMSGRRPSHRLGVPSPGGHVGKLAVAVRWPVLLSTVEHRHNHSPGGGGVGEKVVLSVPPIRLFS